MFFEPDYTYLEKRLCDRLEQKVNSYQWKELQVCSLKGQVYGFSVKGDPLLVYTFGDETSSNRSLILSAVHGDEVTPVYFGQQLISWLKKKKLSGYVVLAPLVNPDGVFRNARTNEKRVDLNRNFPTKDWSNKAHQEWIAQGRQRRRYPGDYPLDQPETKFQKMLLDSFNPTKILSIHAPLNHLDYDGPSINDQRFKSEYVKQCLSFKTELKASSTGVFPGSLGNYAGKDLGIATLTLELPSAHANQVKKYWEQFLPSIETFIEYEIKK